MSPALIAERMAEAAKSNVNGARARYTFVPAAAGTANTTIEISCHRVGLIHGGGHPLDPVHYGNASGVYQQELFHVPSIDVAGWIATSFTRQDWIVLKMDIEGAEFAIFDRLEKLGATCIIDILIWQCHDINPYGRSCSTLERQIRATCPGIAIIEEDQSSLYSGIDSATKKEMQRDFIVNVSHRRF